MLNLEEISFAVTILSLDITIYLNAINAYSTFFDNLSIY
jgi:hypothetical protein